MAYGLTHKRHQGYAIPETGAGGNLAAAQHFQFIVHKEPVALGLMI